MGLKRIIPKKKLERFVHLGTKISQYKREHEEIRDYIMDSFDSPPDVKEDIELYGIQVMRYASGVNSPILNRSAALALVDSKGLYEEAVIQIEVVSEEKLKLLLHQGKLSLEEYNSLFSYNITPKLKVKDKRNHNTEKDEDDAAI